MGCQGTYEEKGMKKMQTAGAMKHMIHIYVLNVEGRN
jgi:hypothetical protein